MYVVVLEIHFSYKNIFLSVCHQLNSPFLHLFDGQLVGASESRVD